MRFSDICPACGFKASQEFSTCPKCGLIVDKYYAKQAERTQREAEIKQELINQADQVNITVEYKEIEDKARNATNLKNKSQAINIILFIVVIFVAINLFSSSYKFSVIINTIMSFLLFAVGYFSALILMIFASLDKKITVRIILSLTAMFALLVQGGCWYFIVGVDIATNGSGGSKLLDPVKTITGLSILICVVWATVIIAKGESRATHTEP